jgi:uncharacterized membrane protein
VAEKTIEAKPVNGDEAASVHPAAGAIMTKDQRRCRQFLYIMIAAVLLSMCYWSAVEINAYNNFHILADAGGFTMSFYYDVHYPSIAHGLQFISFDNHISPDMLLILPVYAIFQSPVTLLLIQVIFVCGTGLLVFFIANDLLHNPLTALLFGLAYLITPGSWYMILAAFHTEPFLVTLYLVTFYFFMKKDSIKFVVSSLLLLGVMEFAPIMGATFGLGLLVYSIFGSGKDTERAKLALVLIGLSVVAYFVYSAAVNTLIAGYANGQYPGVPLTIQATPQVGQYVSLLHSAVSNVLTVMNFSPPLLLYMFSIAILSFGIVVIYEPAVLVLLISPWLANATVLGNEGFFEVGHYTSFALSGLIVAAILAMHAYQKRDHRIMAPKVVMASIICIPVFLCLAAPVFLSQNAFWYQLGENFLFQNTPQQQLAINQLHSVLALLPPNASVDTTYFIFAHVAQRRYPDAFSPPNYFYLYKPDYILFDFNMSINYLAYGFNQTGVATMLIDNTSNPYGLVARNGTAVLLRRLT